jgi:hypothetical protein
LDRHSQSLKNIKIEYSTGITQDDTVKVKFTLDEAIKAQKGSRSIALLFL